MVTRSSIDCKRVHSSRFGDSGCRPCSAIVIGAHVDHLGRGVEGKSLARPDERGMVHFGADDNASGVAEVGPAARAGVEGGDVVVRMAGKTIDTIYDCLTSAPMGHIEGFS